MGRAGVRQGGLQSAVLFDMSQACANLVATGRVTAYWAELPEQLFELDLQAQAAASSGVEAEAAGAIDS